MSGTAPTGQVLLEVRNVRVEFGAHTALHEVSFDLCAGETLGLVGESGSGKSTLARAILRLVPVARGSVTWRGQDLLVCDSRSLRRLRRDLQIVFQDPLASLNPRMTVGESIAEPLKIFEPKLTGAARQARVDAMLERVGLTPAMGRRYPHEFSGGQCQRVGIARAMVLDPQFLICDEPVSSLDVSIQGQIINLLLDLQRDAGTAMLFISHNLALVRHVSHRVLVMYAGSVVEAASRDALFEAPVHPYTRALLAAVPTIVPAGAPTAVPAAAPTDTPVPMAVPSGGNEGLTYGRTGRTLAPTSPSGVPTGLPFAIPSGFATAIPSGFATASISGCAYRDRCAYAVAMCVTQVPLLEQAAPGHWVACHRARDLIS